MSRVSARRSGRYSAWVALFGVVLLSLVLFLPTIRYGFVQYDDDYQVLDNPLIRSLSPRNIVRMFSRFSVTSYYPVRLLSFAVDHALGGLSAAGYHRTNVLLHSVNVLLVYCLAMRLGLLAAGGGLGAAAARAAAEEKRRKKGTRVRPLGTQMEALVPAGPRPPVLGALVCALLFAVHPVVVEPVAWIAGREELLVTLFLLLTVLAYLREEEKAARPARRRWRRLVWPTVFCGLACMSNVVGIVGPALVFCVGLVLAPGGSRVGRSVVRVLARSWPLWLIAALTVGLKFYSDSLPDPRGDVKAGMGLSLSERAFTVLNLYRLNLQTLVWPQHLAVPYPNVVSRSVAEIGVLLGGLAAGATLWLLFRLRRQPVPLLGVLWFLVALAPSAQLVPHHIFRADRFLYLPLAGLTLALGPGTLPPAPEDGRRRAVCATIVTVALALLVRTTLHLPVWQNPISLFSQTLRVFPSNPMAHNNLGNALAAEGRFEEAVPHYSVAVREISWYADAHYNLASALEELGRIDDALRHYSRALAFRPHDPEAHNNLGILLAEQGARTQALVHYSAAIARNPRFAEAHNNVAITLAQLGRTAEAVAHYSESIRCRPDFAEAHNNLGVALSSAGKTGRAITHYSIAIGLKPSYLQARVNLATALLDRGAYAEAERHLYQAVGLAPGVPEIRQLLDRARREGRQRRLKSEVGNRKLRIRPKNADSDSE